MAYSLAVSTEELLNWEWPQFRPLADQLRAETLTQENVADWLAGWSRLDEAAQELYSRLYVATSTNTVDKDAEAVFNRYVESTAPLIKEVDQALKEKLLASGLHPPGFEIALRNMRSDAELFRADNLPLQTEEEKLGSEYDQITGAQTVQWDGGERTVLSLKAVYRETDRSRRESAWRLGMERANADRGALDEVWKRLLALRLKMAANAGRPNYQAYRWQQLLRFDYTPEDCARFRETIHEVVVPAAQRIYQRRQQKLGLDSLRPWDVWVSMDGKPPLKPWDTMDDLVSRTQRVFHRVDPQLGAYFDQMVAENLLDLDNRKNKGNGGYCTSFTLVRKPFIFANSVGIHDDITTLHHEGGHAFHVFESAHLPYFHQMDAPTEFAEVASMGMEFLASAYLAEEDGGYYSRPDAARARVELLHANILFWPYMAVVDGFQDWVYQNPEKAADPSRCDAAWSELWDRFMVGIDWSGLEQYKATGWQRKLHIFQIPFYYVEYGLALLGAVQVWSNALQDQAEATRLYRKALSLGWTVGLPQLFEAAGAKFAMDVPTLKGAVELMEQHLEVLEAEAG